MIDTEALRKKIIDLAIQGKLTQQFPDDGNAEDLYVQIQKEKTRLVKEKEIKKEKTLPEISEEEIPFDVPDNWKWVRLGDICLQITDGTHRTPSYQKEGIPFLSVKNISSGLFDLTDVKYISKEEHSELIKRCKPEKDDVLVCRIGTLGKAITIDLDFEFSIFVSLGLIKTTGKILSDYIVQVINSGYGETWIKDNKAGGAMHTYKINLNSLALLPVPLAPISEINRVLQLCEEVKESIETIDILQAKYTDDRGILRGKIIDAGICGKLTEQLPEDGSAEDLYAQIQEEKARLVKEGKIKKEKPLPEISDDEIPFDIPENWKWVRFGELMWNRDSERIPVSVADRKKLKKIYDYYGASGIIDKVENYLFDEKLLLIGEDGANLISRSTPIAFMAEGKYWVNNHAHVLGCFKYDYLDFVMHYINSISLVPYVTGSAQPKLNQENMNKIPVPLPPFNELIRISNRINKMLF